MNSVKLPQYIWHNQSEVEFTLPDNWQVTVHNIAGSDKPAMSPDEIKAALTSPIGSLPLREMARDKKEVVILFDDMTRSTRPLLPESRPEMTSTVSFFRSRLLTRSLATARPMATAPPARARRSS